MGKKDTKKTRWYTTVHLHNSVRTELSSMTAGDGEEGMKSRDPSQVDATGLPFSELVRVWHYCRARNGGSEEKGRS